MHSSTFPSGSAAYTSAMYGIPMGFMNEHERVTAAEALEKIPVFLNRLHVYSGGKPVYLDQFLFTDNTVGYEHNAQLRMMRNHCTWMALLPFLKIPPWGTASGPTGIMGIISCSMPSLHSVWTDGVFRRSYIAEDETGNPQ